MIPISVVFGNFCGHLPGKTRRNTPIGSMCSTSWHFHRWNHLICRDGVLPFQSRNKRKKIENTYSNNVLLKFSCFGSCMLPWPTRWFCTFCVLLHSCRSTHFDSKNVQLCVRSLWLNNKRFAKSFQWQGSWSKDSLHLCFVSVTVCRPFALIFQINCFKLFFSRTYIALKCDVELNLIRKLNSIYILSVQRKQQMYVNNNNGIVDVLHFLCPQVISDSGFCFTFFFSSELK
jgi:hypothetical protein